MMMQEKAPLLIADQVKARMSAKAFFDRMESHAP
jgi:hypothetical protein